MKPIIVLIVAFLLGLVILHLVTGEWLFRSAGNISMCLMLLFTAFGHFKFTKGMAMMLPPVIPFKTAIVYVSGVIEMVLGVMLLLPKYRIIAGHLLIILFIILLPANIYAAKTKLNLEKANYEGPGIDYLYIRIPMQLFFIIWVAYFSTWWFY